MKRIRLVVTGVLEGVALASALKTLFPEVDFSTVQKHAATTSELLRPHGHPRVHFLHFVDEMLASGDVERVPGGSPFDHVVVVDDLEVTNVDQPEVVTEHMACAARHRLDLLDARHFPKNLSEPESENMRSWVKTSLKSKLRINFQRPDPADRIYLRHPRKLLVRFAPGGRFKTLKIVFEHGLDWVRPVGSGPWRQRPLVADETHVVIITDHRLEDERDACGESEWTRYVGR